ncbi:SusC/RagA family TonB-linked outer membrane protein [Flavobacterium sp. Fl-318]|uniref:SusC/RagA family TonB-linked outer membrane protein n=1 Tax=Flavobacterium cupriresistens TaxID=2893885 RepID=A0ABU4RL25_9FLAO|nr:MULTISPECIES: SusC/RagA family TonB-linked outer membrane protein [unclassified Flavobacterium]MDX6192075.1 SusC/RagA family TonB-linked outer membrane protein [Flavobacterium sp. Fl-318]UFH44669.1 SusC/RagA family TonB-linked outer membrane protein [Flavobacterium sp. F-323]
MKTFSLNKGLAALWYPFIFGFYLFCTPALARNTLLFSLSQQQTQVSGIVTDGTIPISGVSISVKNQNNTVVTDFDGKFTIIVSSHDILIFTYIGFKTIEIPVAERLVINVQMKQDATSLQEVKVNAGYYSVKESERTGSIARITSKDIETQPVTNVLATMQGRMAGVNIIQTTGVPGGGFDIKIRGQNSIRSEGNAPLYLIDGVPYASETIGYNQTSTVYPSTTSPLNSINPDTIESIEILKDADATAIYGSRGANGVVLITTKKGKAGKTTFTVSGSTGTGTVTKFMKLMNTEQYLAMRKQAFENDGIPYNSWDYDINGTWDQSRYTNWQKKLIGGTARITDLQTAISGGSEKTQFLISGNYHTQSSVFPGDFIYKKGDSQFNLSHRSEDNKFRVTLSAGYNSQNNDQPAFDFTYDARSLAPNAPALYDANGNLNWENGTWDNPLRNLNAKFEAKTNDLIANSVLSYELCQGLIIKSSFGYTNLSTVETRTAPSSVYNPDYNISSANSSLYVNNTDRSSWIIEPQISWTKELGLGKIDLLAGTTFQNQTTTRLFQSGTGYSSNNLIYNLASAKYINVLQNDQTIYKYQAFFGRINYNLDKRYIINLTARRDGSSRFGPGNQFATFGAVGLAWLFSNESFLKNTSWLSFGKLRSSYGTTGNDQIGDYQFLNTYSTTGVNYDGTVGLEPTRLYNADFGWETNKKLEAALELGFFHDKIFTTVSWYQNRSSNQLVGVPLPGTTGFTVLQSNLNAVVQNRGLELTLRTNNLTHENFSWTTSVNLTFAKNKLLSFPGLESSSYSQKYRLNEPLNIELVYQYKGVNAQTGVFEFEDINKDGKITFPEDRQKTVDLNPEYYGGLQNQLRFKRWNFDFLLQFVKQKNRISPMGFAGQMSNQPVYKTDRWQETGDLSAYQLYTTGNNGDAVTADYLYDRSDASITDASFIRLKNISLSYQLPLRLNTVQSKIILQGQNLLTFTKFKDGDPEFTSSGFLPPLKVITAGVQLTF